MRAEVDELERAAISNEPVENVWKEAGDVANFAAMVADRFHLMGNWNKQ